VPSGVLDKPPAGTPQFIDIQIAPFMRSTASTLPDVIRNTTSRIGGKTIRVHTPGEFAKAITTLEKAVQKPAAAH